MHKWSVMGHFISSQWYVSVKKCSHQVVHRVSIAVFIPQEWNSFMFKKTIHCNSIFLHFPGLLQQNPSHYFSQLLVINLPIAGKEMSLFHVICLTQATETQRIVQITSVVLFFHLLEFPVLHRNTQPFEYFIEVKNSGLVHITLRK